MAKPPSSVMRMQLLEPERIYSTAQLLEALHSGLVGLKEQLQVMYEQPSVQQSDASVHAGLFRVVWSTAARMNDTHSSGCFIWHQARSAMALATPKLHRLQKSDSTHRSVWLPAVEWGGMLCSCCKVCEGSLDSMALPSVCRNRHRSALGETRSKRTERYDAPTGHGS